MKPVIIVCARRDLGDWRDVDQTLAALSAYADVPVHVFWRGARPPDWSHEFGVYCSPQADGLDTFGAAFGWAVDQVDSDELILCNDDVRVHPDSVRILMDDVQQLVDHTEKVGFVAARSNFAAGGQNIRIPMGEARPHGIRWQHETAIVETERVSPIFAFVTREALTHTTWPDCNWYSDDIMCWDLAQAGYHHYVSRCYVDHLGERCTREHGATQEDLDTAGKEWARANRPDFYAAKLA